MEAGWTIHNVGHGVSPLILHVPHAGTWIPEVERRGLLLGDDELNVEINCMTDWYTDRLAIDALTKAGVSATVFANRASRLVIDPERFVGEGEPMAAIGMGPVYHVTSDLRPLRNDDPVEDQRLLDHWFHPYATAFTELVDQTLADHGHAMIVDLHSFPKRALPYERDPTAQRPGICIGTDPEHTPEGLRAAAFEAFGDHPGGVAENTPFAGTYVPLKHFGRTLNVWSVMIEVRRDLYQQGPGGPLHEGFEEVTDRLGGFLSATADPGRIGPVRSEQRAITSRLR